MRNTLTGRLSSSLRAMMPPKSKKKSGRGKEKKAKRKQEQAEVTVALAKIAAAYEIDDHMETLQAFKRYNRNDLDVLISFHSVKNVSEKDKKWTFELMKSCIRDYYISGGWGWNDRDKWQELTDETSCFLLARDASSGELIGFVSFRFDVDEGIEVLYCYEIHLSPEVRQRGLGKFLMQILELIGHRNEMRKVMLTVFKVCIGRVVMSFGRIHVVISLTSHLFNIPENKLSTQFFRDKMKYSEDETSPLYCDPLYAEDYTYTIYSKKLIRPTASNVNKPPSSQNDHIPLTT